MVSSRLKRWQSPSHCGWHARLCQRRASYTLKTVASFGVYFCHNNICRLSCMRFLCWKLHLLLTCRERCVMLLTLLPLATWNYRADSVRGKLRKTDDDYCSVAKMRSKGCSCSVSEWKLMPYNECPVTGIGEDSATACKSVWQFKILSLNTSCTRCN